MSRDTWFEHRRLRSGRSPRGKRTAASRDPYEVASIPPGAATCASMNEASAAGDAPGPTGHGGEAGGGDGGSIGGDAEELSAAPPTQASQTNGVCITPQVLQDNIDYFVAYNFVAEHCLSRGATEDYLLQRRHSGTCRSHHLLKSMIEASVNLDTES